MMITTAIINQKGGVGKSTTAQALGAGLTLKGKRVLLVDLDPQCNTSFAFGADMSGASVLELLLEETTANEAIRKTEFCDVLIGNKKLSAADRILNQPGAEYLLREGLESVSEQYDFVVVDTPPQLGILSINVLVASDQIVIPAQADVFALQGLLDLTETFRTIKKRCNPDLNLSGVLFTQYDSRSSFTAELSNLANSVATKLDTKIFRSTISRCISIKKAQANQKSIFAYDPKSKAAVEYNSFIDELLTTIEGEKENV